MHWTRPAQLLMENKFPKNVLFTGMLPFLRVHVSLHLFNDLMEPQHTRIQPAGDPTNTCTGMVVYSAKIWIH